jgi:hypothetical protein
MKTQNKRRKTDKLKKHNIIYRDPPILTLPFLILKKAQDTLETSKLTFAGRVAQVVQHLPRNYEASELKPQCHEKKVNFFLTQSLLVLI